MHTETLIKDKIDRCEGCPAFECKGRLVIGGAKYPQVLFLGGAPREFDEYSPEPFQDNSGKLFRNIVDIVMKENPEYKDVRCGYLHSIQCIAEETAQIAKHCAPISRNLIDWSKVKAIMPLGQTAARCVGLGGTINALRGRHIKVNVLNKSYDCVPTYHPGVLYRKENTGLVKTIKSDILRVFKAAIDEKVTLPTIQELTCNYMFAKNVPDAIKIFEHVLAYRLPDGSLPPIAVDTETTGLDTWKSDFRCIAMSLAWGDGQAAAILLNHREMLDDWTLLRPYMERLLAADNNKVFHNYKFDYKVLKHTLGMSIRRVAWDSMFGEYLLDENKQGLYGLKEITSARLPEFADYEKNIKGQLKGIEPLEQIALQLTEIKNRSLAIKEESLALRAERKAASTKDDSLRCSRLLTVLATEKKGLVLKRKELNAKRKEFKLELKTRTFEDINVDDMLLYAAIDTECTLRISKQQIREINKESANLKSVMYTVMLPSAESLGNMEHDGVRIDLPYVEYLEGEFRRIMAEEEQKCYDILGRQFKITSTHELENILISERGIKLTKRTKKKTKFKLDIDVLESLMSTDPLLLHVIRYRKAHQAVSLYMKAFKKKSAVDGKVHANFNLTTTATGRTSSSGPNLQNIPPEILGYNIKKCFIPDDPATEDICNMDYSGAEIRVLCAYAKDEGLIKTLNDGLNMHSYVASQIFGYTYDEVQGRKKYLKKPSAGEPGYEEQWTEALLAVIMEKRKVQFDLLEGLRQTAKRAVFLTIYGGGGSTLYEQLVKDDPTITLERCEEIISTFLERFPVIQDYMNTIKNMVDQWGYVVSKFGRRRRFPLAGMDYKLRNASYREGINMPIQSTSSDIVLCQLVDIMHYGRDLGIKVKLTVHDSIVFTYPKANKHLIAPFLTRYAEERVLEKFPWMPVPFLCEAGVGPSYGECKEMIKD